jgi:Skp family chaperone for outer membrane proteins
MKKLFRNWKTILLVYSSLAATFILIVTILSFFAGSTTVFVDLQKVYNGFKLKEELEAEYNQIITEQSKTLDSLNLLLIKAQNDGDPKQYELLNNEYQLYSEQLSATSDNLSEKLQSQIWAQITQFFTEYGEDHNLDFVFGAAGNGSIMYANKELDVTEEIIVELNDWYEGIQ